MNGNQMYSQIELSTEVMSADNYRLIQMLFNRCLQHIDAAKGFIEANEIVKRHQSIRKAIDIIDYLRLCLNHQSEKARELSQLLDGLYEHMRLRLLEANMKNEVNELEAARKVLLDIKEGWDGMKRA